MKKMFISLFILLAITFPLSAEKNEEMTKTSLEKKAVFEAAGKLLGSMAYELCTNSFKKPEKQNIEQKKQAINITSGGESELERRVTKILLSAPLLLLFAPFFTGRK